MLYIFFINSFFLLEVTTVTQYIKLCCLRPSTPVKSQSVYKTALSLYSWESIFWKILFGGKISDFSADGQQSILIKMPNSVAYLLVWAIYWKCRIPSPFAYWQFLFFSEVVLTIILHLFIINILFRISYLLNKLVITLGVHFHSLLIFNYFLIKVK